MRDMDTVRTVLLWLESQPHWEVSAAWQGTIPGVDSWRELMSYLKMLGDAGYVERKTTAKGVVTGWRMTWQGHEFTGTIRDDEIWRKTKSKAAEIGGASLKIVGEIAAALIKEQFKRLTGLDIG